MAKKPTLTVIASTATGPSPPRKLGEHGRALWDAVMREYRIDDRGGVEILAQICAALDRAEALAEQINADGPVIVIKGSLREHPALRAELGNRSFIARNLQRLGLNVEAVKPIGRPAGWSPGMS